jgi:hypothetical protein
MQWGLTAWLHARLCKLQKRCTRLSAASDKACQLLAHGQLFSPGTLASSTTKTGCHNIAEILLIVALKHKKIYHSMGITITDTGYFITSYLVQLSNEI